VLYLGRLVIKAAFTQAKICHRNRNNSDSDYLPWLTMAFLGNATQPGMSEIAICEKINGMEWDGTGWNKIEW
jgi:hypothetical protein